MRVWAYYAIYSNVLVQKIESFFYRLAPNQRTLNSVIFDEFFQIVCNNVILKYVEDELVLSTNIRQVSIVSVNGNWEHAFTELTPGDLVMRKLASVSDLTVCLDRRSSTGKIESYEVGLF